MTIEGSEQYDPEAGMMKLNTTEFVFLVIGVGANEIHRRIIAELWVERNL